MLTLDGLPFAASRARFLDKEPASQERSAKIYVTVEFPGLSHSLAQLDTGAAWSVLDLATAEALELLDGDGDRERMRTHVGIVEGKLERVPLKLFAEEGDSLAIEATFLVSRDWPGRTFLGYTGLLDRVRIALDPSPGKNWFYFGEVD
jgi:hypothetical protein